jgi:PPOX class probable F420-dependent enzyme
MPTSSPTSPARQADVDPQLLSLATESHLGALAALKRDGRPQLSMVNYHLDTGADGGLRVRVSVVDARAKVVNLQRDPRASLLVHSRDGWSYAVLEGTAAFSPVSESEDDATVAELVDVYRGIRGEHPDWDDYRAAMVRDRRRVLRIDVSRVYGLVQ